MILKTLFGVCLDVGRSFAIKPVENALRGAGEIEAVVSYSQL